MAGKAFVFVGKARAYFSEAFISQAPYGTQL
jgi:hypothetical protein